MTGPRVAVVNLGCRVNRVETDLIARKLLDAGCALVGQDEAELVVINTCAVTGEAQVKTRKATRHAAHLPTRPIVVATGCAANLFADELRALSERVVVMPDKARVADRCLELLGVDTEAPVAGQHLAISPTPTGRMRPGIKIQDGCDNRCTYCIVWKARGPSRSLQSAHIVRAVDEAVERGAHEVVLTGINLGCYRTGTDDSLGPDVGLAGLLDHLLERTGIERIRLSSIEPPDVTGELLSVMARSAGRVAPFLHICLQAGCDRTLRRMGRPYDTGYFARVVRDARAWLPDVAIGTDVIVAFPGETDEDFEESLAFCEQMAFARMHVFRYSKRPGTPAAAMADQVDANTSRERGARMRILAQAMREAQIATMEGKRDAVLVQSPGRAVCGQLFDVVVDTQLPVGSLCDVTLHWTGSQLVGVTG